MYKVFINDKVITLTDNYDDYSSEYDCLYMSYNSDEALFDSIDLLSKSEVVNELCVYSNDLKNTWKTFQDKYKIIEAAGGIVVRDQKVLMILKNDHWDLPKGKIDGKESKEDAALREVKEECGLNEISISNDLGITYYLYQEGEEFILKKTHWFKMNAETDGPLKGDAKEGITDVQWIDADDWKKKSTDSYSSVRELLSSIL